MVKLLSSGHSNELTEEELILKLYGVAGLIGIVLKYGSLGFHWLAIVCLSMNGRMSTAQFDKHRC